MKGQSLRTISNVSITCFISNSGSCTWRCRRRRALGLVAVIVRLVHSCKFRLMMAGLTSEIVSAVKALNRATQLQSKCHRNCKRLKYDRIQLQYGFHTSKPKSEPLFLFASMMMSVRILLQYSYALHLHVIFYESLNLSSGTRTQNTRPRAAQERAQNTKQPPHKHNDDAGNMLVKSQRSHALVTAAMKAACGLQDMKRLATTAGFRNASFECSHA
jgi:hypothetical protein